MWSNEFGIWFKYPTSQIYDNENDADNNGDDDYSRQRHDNTHRELYEHEIASSIREVSILVKLKNYCERYSLESNFNLQVNGGNWLFKWKPRETLEGKARCNYYEFWRDFFNVYVSNLLICIIFWRYIPMILCENKLRLQKADCRS